MNSQMRVTGALMMPYHIRTDTNIPWQQYYLYQMFMNTEPGIADSITGLRIQNMNDSKSDTSPPGFGYKFKHPKKIMGVTETMLLDEVDKKMYFFHNPELYDPDFTIREASIEIKKNSDGSRTITEIHSFRLFLGRLGFKPVDHLIKWFLNPFDGSIFQITSTNEKKQSDAKSFHTVSWLKLDDGIQIEAPSGIPYAGKLKLMDKFQLEFPRFNLSDPYECGILFSKSGRKLLMRFRIPNPVSLNQTNPPEYLTKTMTDPEHSFTHDMTMAPNYALFGLDYDSHQIQLLTQFVPKSVENHSDLLISARLLPIYCTGIGFLNSKAKDFLSQRSHTIGQYLKYTFFSTINKKVIGIVAVKSLIKTLQNGQLSLTPKKVWFPLEDDNTKMAFKNLKEKVIKWDMLSQKINVMLVFGGEFILEVFDPDKMKPLKQLATIRVKLGAQYKDYKECAGCGKVEKHKRRSKNGKRISQFKVCGWCKDHNFHKMASCEHCCHYCSEKCADDHWPKHHFEHERMIEEKKEKTIGKKKSKQ